MRRTATATTPSSSGGAVSGGGDGIGAVCEFVKVGEEVVVDGVGDEIVKENRDGGEESDDGDDGFGGS